MFVIAEEEEEAVDLTVNFRHLIIAIVQQAMDDIIKYKRLVLQGKAIPDLIQENYDSAVQFFLGTPLSNYFDIEISSDEIFQICDERAKSGNTRSLLMH